MIGQIRQTVCATDGVAAHIDELQFSMGEGPCVDACRTGRPVIIADLRQEVTGRGEAARRWPMFTGALTDYLASTDARIRAVIGLPLRVHGPGLYNQGVFGAVDLHYREPFGTDGREIAERAQDAADAAALAVLGYLPHGRRLTSTWWQHEANLRTKVQQATGVIMQALQVPADQALLRLHASAFAHSQTVTDRSQHILSRPPIGENDL